MVGVGLAPPLPSSTSSAALRFAWSVGEPRLCLRGCPSSGPLLSSPSRRGCSSAGRAPGSHPGGQGFEPPQLHFLPLGVTGNTPDSGSGESWFEPRRGNLKRDATMSRVALPVFSPECHRFCHRFSRHHLDITRRGAGFLGVACKRFSRGVSVELPVEPPVEEPG